MKSLRKETQPVELTVVIPAFREQDAVAAVVRRVRETLDVAGWTHEILLVDDGSDDGTAQAAAAAGARVLRRPRNLGNGSAVKMGLRLARGRYTALMDADGQHDPADLARMLEHLPAYDMVVGARDRKSPQALPRRVANWMYNRFATYIAEYPIEDLTSGFRVMKTELARRFLYLLPNKFSYPTTITLSMIRAGYAVKYVPVRTAVRQGKSKIRIFKDGIRFFLIMLKIGTLFEPFRLFLPVSATFMALGLAYGAWMVGVHHHFSNGVLLLLVAGILSFLLSLIAQQVASLHFVRSDGPLEQEEAQEETEQTSAPARKVA